MYSEQCSLFCFDYKEPLSAGRDISSPPYPPPLVKLFLAGIDLNAFDNEPKRESPLDRTTKWCSPQNGLLVDIWDGDNDGDPPRGWVAKVERINYTLKTDAGSPKRTSFNVHIITVFAGLFFSFFLLITRLISWLARALGPKSKKKEKFLSCLPRRENRVIRFR